MESRPGAVSLGKQTLTAAADFAGAANTTGDWDEDRLDQRGTAGGIMRAEGGVLRTLHATLKEQDPTFADLRRVTDAQGRYLWIHPRYLPIYQPPLPEIPT